MRSARSGTAARSDFRGFIQASEVDPAPHARKVSLATEWRASVWLYGRKQCPRRGLGLRRRRVEPRDGAAARAGRAPGDRARAARGGGPARPYASRRRRRGRAGQHNSKRPPRRTTTRSRARTATGGSPVDADRSLKLCGDDRPRHRRADRARSAAHRTPGPGQWPSACAASPARRRAPRRTAFAGLTAPVASVNEGIRREVGRRRQCDLTSKRSTIVLGGRRA